APPVVPESSRRSATSHHRPRQLATVLALALAGALVVELLALDERHAQLDARALEIDRERHDRDPLLAHLGSPGLDLPLVGQQLALAGRGRVVRVPRGDPGNVRGDEPQLAAPHQAVGLLDRALPRPQALDLGPLESDPALELLQEVVEVARLAVGRD